MGFLALICLQLVLAGVLFSTIVDRVTAQPKLDCHSCGNISIPFPFGVGDGCYLNSDFNITCNLTTNPPKPYLGDSDVEVIEINIDGQLNALSYVAGDCYGPSGETYWRSEFTLSKFRVSKSKNKFIVIGCDSYADFWGYRDPGETYWVGCTTTCDKIEYVNDQSCFGSGCCQIEIPYRLYNITIAPFSYYNHTNVSDFNPCTYAFIVEESKFNFSRDYLKRALDDATFPLALEWSVDEKNTSIAKACKGNAISYVPDNRLGFRCRCGEGYEGNPYLGCYDIDECKYSTLNACQRTCVNTPGSYTCTCPKGYHGDGRKDGQGCIADRSMLTFIVIGCSIGLGIPLLVATIWLLYKFVKRRNKKKRREEFFKRNGGLLLEQQASSGGGVEMPIKLLTSKELERATDSYNENRILGRGGQGTVYKGMLEDGRIVAIKKSKRIDESQLGPFINEVVVLQQINHRNIVKLLGCCLETEVPMLVYEFIPNGMLSHYLHCQNEESPMTWDMRSGIAVEVADALAYLHSAASNPIYHCDIKSANILLDEKYRAKIADFGIARSIDLDQTHLTTPNVQGTFGYLDPEYFRTSQFTDKSDVYSFGVVLAELLTGQKPISSTRSEYERSLANYFLVAMEEDHLFDIVDIRVVKEGPEEAIVAIAKLAQRCLNMSGRKRPTMREVVTELQSIRRSQEVPTNQHDDEEVEVKHYNDITESWEATSTSTMSYLNSGTQSLSIDFEPLLSTC